MKKSARHYDRA